MAVSWRPGQYVSVIANNTWTLPAAPVQNNLMFDICGHFQNGTSVNQNGWTSFFESPNAAQWDIGGGYKYAGAAESATQTPGALGAGLTHSALEFTGVTGTIGTDLPTQHNGIDRAISSSAYSTTSFNTAAANTGILGLVGACTVNNNTDTFTSAVLTGGRSPQIIAYFLNNTSGNRHTLNAIFLDFFPINGTAVQYTLGNISGNFSVGGTPVGFYALISIANFSDPFVPPGWLKNPNPNRGKGKDKSGNALILDSYNQSILKIPNRQEPPFRRKLSQFTTMASASITDALTATDTFTAVLNSSGSIAETANAVDTFTAVTAFAGSISESANAVDTVSAAVTLGASVAEAAQASDVYSAKLGTVPAFQVTEGWSHPLNTTLINFFSYDPKTELLMVNFTDDTERTYSGVPFGVANQFWATSNPDLFYNTTIKDSYPRVFA